MVRSCSLHVLIPCVLHEWYPFRSNVSFLVLVNMCLWCSLVPLALLCSVLVQTLEFCRLAGVLRSWELLLPFCYPSSVPSTHMECLLTPTLWVSGHPMPSSGFHEHMHTCVCRYTYTLIHSKISLFFKEVLSGEEEITSSLYFGTRHGINLTSNS